MPDPLLAPLPPRPAALLCALAVLACGAPDSGSGKAGTDLQGSSDAAPATAEILWDRWGVPHVYGEDVAALGRGYGWAQMRLHGDAVLRLYGEARGRAAEYWGEEHLPTDRLVRSLGLPDAGLEDLAAAPEDLRRFVEAFVDGMNAWAEAHPQAIPEEVGRVLPVEPADPFRHGRRAVFAFVAVTGDERPLVDLAGDPSERLAGSNGWAIGPSRSASGNALLLQNPHLPWGEPLMRFTEAHLVRPEAEVYGVTLIGLPFPAIAFNERLGWTHTVNTIDALDTYRLAVVEGGYRYDGTVRPFETEAQALLVRRPDGGSRTDTLVVRRSVHGPVLEAADGGAVAVRAPLLDGPSGVGQWWEMGHARDLEAFREAMARRELAMFNTIYADADGHVYFQFSGRVPVRPRGDFAFWSGELPGDTSAVLWSRVLGSEALPTLVDPPGGFVQNSNSPPWFATVPSPLEPAAFPAYLAPTGLLMREQRGLEMLTSDESITFDELLEMRHSNRMLLADRLLDDLLPAAEASGDSGAVAAARVLSAWDRSADPGSRGTLVFTSWVQALCEARRGCGFRETWDPERPLSTPDGLAEPEAAVHALARAAAQVQERFGALDVPWGEVMRLSDDLPGNGAPGDPFGVFHVVAYAGGEEGFRPVAGDTWVAAVEFTPEGPRGRLLLSYGNSSRPDSPHHLDQLPLLSRQEMRPLWFSRGDVEANVVERETVPPGSG